MNICGQRVRGSLCQSICLLQTLFGDTRLFVRRDLSNNNVSTQRRREMFSNDGPSLSCLRYDIIHPITRHRGRPHLVSVSYWKVLTASIANNVCRFPQKMIDTISKCRVSGSTFPAEDIKHLVQVIDSLENPLCNDLDGPSHLALSTVVLNSAPCGARHRGFFLVAVGLLTKIYPTLVLIRS